MNWYVGLVKDWQRAQKDLREQGYGVRLPKRYERVQEGRKVHARAYLRFPGYIFIACEPNELGPISNTRGMDSAPGRSALVGGTTPYRLPAGYLERISKIEDDELAAALAVAKPIPRKDLAPGDEVEIAGDRDHPAFGQRGHYFASERGTASVLCGAAMWKVPEADLKRVEAERKAA